MVKWESLSREAWAPSAEAVLPEALGRCLLLPGASSVN